MSSTPCRASVIRRKSSFRFFSHHQKCPFGCLPFRVSKCCISSAAFLCFSNKFCMSRCLRFNTTSLSEALSRLWLTTRRATFAVPMLLSLREVFFALFSSSFSSSFSSFLRIALYNLSHLQWKRRSHLQCFAFAHGMSRRVPLSAFKLDESTAWTVPSPLFCAGVAKRIKKWLVNVVYRSCLYLRRSRLRNLGESAGLFEVEETQQQLIALRTTTNKKLNTFSSFFFVLFFNSLFVSYVFLFFPSSFFLELLLFTK